MEDDYSYLDELEGIKGYGFDTHPIYELSLLLAADLSSARVIKIVDQEKFDDIQIEDLTSNENFLKRLSPHVKAIAKKITKSLESGEIKAVYLRKNFESGAIDIHNTLIDSKQFHIFLGIYNLDQYITWSKSDSLLGFRLNQELNIFTEAVNVIRRGKKYAVSKKAEAEFEDIYQEYIEKIDENYDYIREIIRENVGHRTQKRASEAILTEKPLSVRTENNYLRLVLSLANGIEGFNPKKPYEAAQLILDEIEIKISKETIAGYISKAYKLASIEAE